MEHEDFDKALVAAAFDLASTRGWVNFTVADAARAAGLPLAEARLRFPGRGAILMRLGRMADAAALADDGAPATSTQRDRLFDMIMRRIDVFQAHRGGVIAMFKALPADPLTALALWGATLNSMAWLLDGAGISPVGLDRTLRAHGLAAVWLSVVRAWMRDESIDLSSTMAALDRALDRAEQMSGWLGRGAAKPAADAGLDMPIDPAPPPSAFTAEPPPGDFSDELQDSGLADDAMIEPDPPITTPPPPPAPPASPPV
jgi:AcrR family transcriptional regulator